MLRIFSLFLLLALTSCGPVYDTRYHYSPPETYEGSMCVNNCLSNHSQCKHNCSTIEQSCKNSKEWMHQTRVIADLAGSKNQRVTDDLRWDHQSGYYECESKKARCDSECDFNYRMCYTNCGGEVIAETYCSAFCPK